MWPFSKEKAEHSSKFEAAFLPDTFSGTSEKGIAIPEPYLASLLSKWGGTSFNRGIYRLLGGEELPTWTAILESGFPAFAGRLIPFGFDWLGRMFARACQIFCVA